MSRKKLKARDKQTRKMTKDGLIERNVTTGEDTLISSREADIDLRGYRQQDAPLDAPEATSSLQARRSAAFSQVRIVFPSFCDVLPVSVTIGIARVLACSFS